MKTILAYLLLLFSLTLYSADCDKPKPKENGGCKIEEQSDELIKCLINAKNEKEEQKCHSLEKSRNCQKISKKFKKIKNIQTGCNLFFSDEKIKCLLKNDNFNKCSQKQ